MHIINFIFHIGVVLAVYNFLWWIVMLVFKILRGMGQKHIFEIYFIKAIRYLFLADVIFLVAIEESGGLLLLNYFIIAGLIMLVYFMGKIQKNQMKSSFFSVRTSGNIQGMNSIFNQIKPIFDIRYEILVVTLALGLYIFFLIFPGYAYNPIANWFLENIKGIEEAPIFGFIFKVIGFFFLVSVLLKMVNGIMTVLTGRGLSRRRNDDDDNHFDDYTEVE
ncbi:MAG: hypothetical protein WC994_04930 [Brumimicrobium sp.]